MTTINAVFALNINSFHQHLTEKLRNFFTAMADHAPTEGVNPAHIAQLQLSPALYTLPTVTEAYEQSEDLKEDLEITCCKRGFTLHSIFWQTEQVTTIRRNAATILPHGRLPLTVPRPITILNRLPAFS